MKIVGYEETDLPIEEIKFIELASVQLEATPEELRKMAVFLSSAADDMESMGAVYDHEHLSDKQPGFEVSPHVVVCRSPEK
jgi:hypothetical protein